MPDQKIDTSSRSEIMRNTIQGTLTGSAIMIAISPLVNSFNNTSVVATKYHLSWLEPYKKVYTGVNGAELNSCKNFFRGMQAHYLKEIPRLLFKPAGLFVLKPELDRHFHPQYASIMFAAALAMAEMIVANPPDSIRVQKQAGKPVDYSIKSLYRGSLGNGIRQFYTWLAFSQANNYLDNKLSIIGIYPDTITGIVIKGIGIGIAMAPIFPIERLKNELQHSVSERQPIAKNTSSFFYSCKKAITASARETAAVLYPAGFPQDTSSKKVDYTPFNSNQTVISNKGTSESSYISAAKKIYATGGKQSFFCGIGAKFISNSIQAIGAVALTELGKRKLHDPQHSTPVSDRSFGK